MEGRLKTTVFLFRNNISHQVFIACHHSRGNSESGLNFTRLKNVNCFRQWIRDLTCDWSYLFGHAHILKIFIFLYFLLFTILLNVLTHLDIKSKLFIVPYIHLAQNSQIKYSNECSKRDYKARFKRSIKYANIGLENIFVGVLRWVLLTSYISMNRKYKINHGCSL